MILTASVFFNLCGKQTDRQTDRQTNRQTNKHINAAKKPYCHQSNWVKWQLALITPTMQRHMTPAWSSHWHLNSRTSNFVVHVRCQYLGEMIRAAGDHVKQTFGGRQTSSLDARNLLQRSHAVLQNLEKQRVANWICGDNIQTVPTPKAAGDSSNEQF